MNPGNSPCMLIAVPNFSVLRMNAIRIRDEEINKTKYDVIRWLIGEPPAGRNKWRMEALKKTNRVYLVDTANIIPVSTLRFKDMIATLENIWLQERYDYQITIGSLGSKMQHVGTFFFLHLHKDVGLWLSEPKAFRANKFSVGSGSAWVIRFGSTSILRKMLDRYMTYTWTI
jgi:hypothetical protein